MSGRSDLANGQGSSGFSLGRVVRKTFGVISRNVLVIGVLACVVAVLGRAADLGIEASFGLFHIAGNQPLTLVAQWLVDSIFRSIATGAITFVVVDDLAGRRSSLGDTLKRGLALAVPLAGLGLVFGIGIGAATAIFIVPGILLAARWLVASSTRAVEAIGIRAALTRSKELTAGARWKLAVLAVVAFILTFALGAGLGFLELRTTRGLNATMFVAVREIVQLIWSIIIVSIHSTGIAVCYVELYTAKTGTVPEMSGFAERST